MSEIYSNSAFSIPIYYGLKTKDQYYVKTKLEQVMKKLKIIKWGKLFLILVFFGLQDYQLRKNVNFVRVTKTTYQQKD